MQTNFFYQLIAGTYDLLDVIYFRNDNNSPRKAVMEAIAPEDKILDLCTGTAANAIAISQALPGTRIVGIDLSRNMLQVASGKIEKAGIANIRLLEMDATQTHFASESFDKILLSLVLHEMDEPLRGKIISEAKRVIKKDGRIILTEWERSPQRSRRLLFLPIHLLEPKPYREFLGKDLAAYFEEHGLIVEKYIHCDYTKVLVLKLAK